MKTNPRSLALAALFLARGLILPFLTMQIPQIGSMLLPMHLPVLLCSFVAGGFWGLLVGAITPLLRSLIFSMPVLYPIAIAMATRIRGVPISKSRVTFAGSIRPSLTSLARSNGTRSDPS